MIDYKDTRNTKKEKEIESITCDKCGKLYDSGSDSFEIQEFQHINFRGGYGSVFGDGTQVNCDLCQHLSMANKIDPLADINFDPLQVKN